MASTAADIPQSGQARSLHAIPAIGLGQASPIAGADQGKQVAVNLGVSLESAKLRSCAYVIFEERVIVAPAARPGGDEASVAPDDGRMQPCPGARCRRTS